MQIELEILKINELIHGSKPGENFVILLSEYLKLVKEKKKRLFFKFDLFI